MESLEENSRTWIYNKIVALNAELVTIKGEGEKEYKNGNIKGN